MCQGSGIFAGPGHPAFVGHEGRNIGHASTGRLENRLRVQQPYRASSWCVLGGAGSGASRARCGCGSGGAGVGAGGGAIWSSASSRGGDQGRGGSGAGAAGGRARLGGVLFLAGPALAPGAIGAPNATVAAVVVIGQHIDTHVGAHLDRAACQQRQHSPGWCWTLETQVQVHTKCANASSAERQPRPPEEHWHTPPLHCERSGHLVPHLPQLLRSVLRLTQPPVQESGVSAGSSEVQAPAMMHTRSAVQY